MPEEFPREIARHALNGSAENHLVILPNNSTFRFGTVTNGEGEEFGIAAIATASRLDARYGDPDETREWLEDQMRYSLRGIAAIDAVDEITVVHRLGHGRLKVPIGAVPNPVEIETEAPADA